MTTRELVVTLVPEQEVGVYKRAALLLMERFRDKNWKGARALHTPYDLEGAEVFPLGQPKLVQHPTLEWLSTARHRTDDPADPGIDWRKCWEENAESVLTYCARTGVMPMGRYSSAQEGRDCAWEAGLSHGKEVLLDILREAGAGVPTNAPAPQVE